MNLYQLYCFQVVAQENHITRAAQKLNIAQPALSVTITKLEKQLGVRLFDRVGRQIVLNDCGRMLLEDVNVILAQWELATNKLEQYKRDNRQQIKIASTGVLFSQRMIRDFRMEYPSITVKQSNIMTRDIEPSLLQHKCDFVISSILIEHESIAHYFLKKESLYVLASRDHPFAAKESVSITDLDGQDFIDLPEGYAYRETVDSWFRAAGVHHNVVFECFSAQFSDLVKQGIGLAFATDSTVKTNSYPPEIVAVPIVPAFERNLYILWENSGIFNSVCRSFYDFAINYNLDSDA